MVILQIAILIIIMFLSSSIGHVFVLKSLETMQVSPKHHSKISAWLGYLERALVSMFVCLGLTGETVFIFATKAAIMNYRIPKDLDGEKQKEISEYMLAGTMVSYLVALLFGILGRALIKGQIV